MAQRSAAAAREITALILSSVSKVETGSVLVDRAGLTMEEIVASVQKVAGYMSDITNASQEQSAGIEQVNQAITQMDEVTQQNAALVEQAAAAAENMQRQANNLMHLVRAFKLVSSTQAPIDLPTAFARRVPHEGGRTVDGLRPQAPVRLAGTSARGINARGRLQGKPARAA